MKVKLSNCIFMKRNDYLKKIEEQFRVHDVCAILGPRQVGKTTLAKMYTEKHPKEDLLFLGSFVGILSFSKER